MPMISFSGETSQGPFWRQILKGIKVQTCRRPRKYPIHEGDILQLYWKVRLRKDKKPIHFIGQARCIKVERKRYANFAFNDEFAKRDGFRDAEEMQEWFGNPLVYADDEMDVIHFKLLTDLPKPFQP